MLMVILPVAMFTNIGLFASTVVEYPVKSTPVRVMSAAVPVISIPFPVPSEMNSEFEIKAASAGVAASTWLAEVIRSNKQFVNVAAAVII